MLIAGDVDSNIELDAGGAGGICGCCDLGEGPGCTRSIFDYPEEGHAFQWELDLLRAVSNIEENGECECCSR